MNEIRTLLDDITGCDIEYMVVNPKTNKIRVLNHYQYCSGDGQSSMESADNWTEIQWAAYCAWQSVKIFMEPPQ